MDNSHYGFDPTYGYTLATLLNVSSPKEPIYFDEFWQKRYRHALTVNPAPQITLIHEDKFGWRVFSIGYTSTDSFPIKGWLLVPTLGEVKRGFIVGHGYGGETNLTIICLLQMQRCYFLVFADYRLALILPFPMNPTFMCYTILSVKMTIF